MKHPKKAPPGLVTLEGQASNIVITPLESVKNGFVVFLAICTPNGGGVPCTGTGKAMADICHLLQPGQRVQAMGHHRPGRKGIEAVFQLRWIEAL
jgi:hypothetical protein